MMNLSSYLRTRLWIPLFFIPLVFFATLKTHKTRVADGDEVHYLLIAESIFDDFDLRMDNQYPDRHSFMPHPSDRHVIVTPSGIAFPVHDIGLPIMMLPMLSFVHLVVPHVPEAYLRLTKVNDFVKVTYTFFSYQSMLLSSFLTLFLFHYLRRQFGFSDRQALAGSLLAIVTPPLLTYGYHFHTEIYSAFFVLCAIFYLYNEDLVARPFVYALCLFVLSWLHVKNLPLVAALWLIWTLKSWRERPSIRHTLILIPSVFLIIACGLRLFLHHHYFGHFYLNTPRTDLRVIPLSVHYVPGSLIGMVVDRQYGLLFSSPLFWFLPGALFLISRKEWRFWWTSEGIVMGAYIAGLLPFFCWWGGGSPSGRHLVTIVPLLWPPLLLLIRACWNSRDGWLVKAIIGLSLVISAYIWQNPKNVWWTAEGHNPWMDVFTIHDMAWQKMFPAFFDRSPYFIGQILFWVFAFFLLGLRLYKSGSSLPVSQLKRRTKGPGLVIRHLIRAGNGAWHKSEI